MMLFRLLHTVTAGIWGNRRKSPSYTWYWRPVIIIILICILNLVLTTGWVSNKWKKSRGKPGTCPQQNITCEFAERDLCQKDFNCRSNMKCCNFTCGMKCLDPKTDLCRLTPRMGSCDNFSLRWFYSPAIGACEYFFYSGCQGNVNNFPSKKICEQTCEGTVRKGNCPPFPFKDYTDCSEVCEYDRDCPSNLKCCASSCGLVCTRPWKVKPWDCPPQPTSCMSIEKPMCETDDECAKNEKCCPNCGLECLEKPKIHNNSL